MVIMPPLGAGAGADGRFESHDGGFSVERRPGPPEREQILAHLSTSYDPGRRARRAVPVRGRAKSAQRAGAELLEADAPPRRRDRLQPARHPRQPPQQPGESTTSAPATLANASSTRCWCARDPSFARLEDTFEPARRDVAVPVHYTGFVVGPPTTAPRTRAAAHPGRVGRRRSRRRARCCGPPRRRSGRSAVPMKLIAGPFCGESRVDAAGGDGACGVELVGGARARRGTASAPPVVSQCGCDRR